MSRNLKIETVYRDRRNASPQEQIFKNPMEALRYHVTGAIERGEKEPIVAQENGVNAHDRCPDAAARLSAAYRTVGNPNYSMGKTCLICGMPILNVTKVHTCQNCRHEQRMERRAK